MRWSEIEGDLLTIPAARMKRERPHEVPLPPLALEQLPARPNKDHFVFGSGKAGFDGWSAGKRRLDIGIAVLRAKEAGVALPEKVIADDEARIKALEPYFLPAWGLHDLRRTFSTTMNERGLADPHVIEAVLAHQGVQAGVAGVYNRSAYREGKRAALAAWAKVIDETVSIQCGI